MLFLYDEDYISKTFVRFLIESKSIFFKDESTLKSQNFSFGNSAAAPARG